MSPDPPEGLRESVNITELLLFASKIETVPKGGGEALLPVPQTVATRLPFGELVARVAIVGSIPATVKGAEAEVLV